MLRSTLVVMSRGSCNRGNVSHEGRLSRSEDSKVWVLSGLFRFCIACVRCGSRCSAHVPRFVVSADVSTELASRCLVFCLNLGSARYSSVRRHNFYGSTVSTSFRDSVHRVIPGPSALSFFPGGATGWSPSPTPNPATGILSPWRLCTSAIRSGRP